MSQQQQQPAPASSSNPSEPAGHIGRFAKFDSKSCATYDEATAKTEEWRKEHKVPKRKNPMTDPSDALFRTRVRLRPAGFEAILYQRRVVKAA